MILMDKYFDKSYREIIEEAASSSPTPGGGNVSAMVACMGNAMVSMVANLTSGKEKYAEYQSQVDALLAKSKSKFLFSFFNIEVHKNFLLLLVN